MVDESEIRSVVNSAVSGMELDDLVDNYDAKVKISKIIQDAIVAALLEYDKQQNQ